MKDRKATLEEAQHLIHLLHTIDEKRFTAWAEAYPEAYAEISDAICDWLGEVHPKKGTVH